MIVKLVAASKMRLPIRLIMVTRAKVRKLYVLATPIGNLGDLSVRAIEILRSCELIAAEDTRVARTLLAALGIKGQKTISARAHNERAAAQKLVAHDASTICYIPDAGTPAVSDPGALLVASLRAAGFVIVPIPGPSAVSTAVAVAGVAGSGHVFVGFLPHHRRQAEARLLAAAGLGEPIVIFATPRRIGSDISLVATVFGGIVPTCLCRELTKIHEQIVAGSVTEIAAMLAAGTVPSRGEFVVVVEPSEQTLGTATAVRTARLLSRELPVARAAKLAAKICGGDARGLYRILIGSD